MAGFRPNSEIIGKFRKLKKNNGHFVKRQKMTPTDEFLGRRRVLEPRYRSMKY